MVSLFKELKRRNVFRVAIAYLVVGWLLVQVLGIATDSFEAPDWVMKLFITLTVIGFIPTVLFSWAFELTPEGLKKESDINPENSQSMHTAKKLDYITILAAVIVLGIVSWQQYNPSSVDSRLRGNDVLGNGNNKKIENNDNVNNNSVIPHRRESQLMNPQSLESKPILLQFCPLQIYPKLVTKNTFQTV